MTPAEVGFHFEKFGLFIKKKQIKSAVLKGKDIFKEFLNCLNKKPETSSGTIIFQKILVLFYLMYSKCLFYYFIIC